MSEFYKSILLKNENVYFYFKKKDRYQKIPAVDILFVKAENNYTEVQLRNESKILCSKTIIEWVTEFQGSSFIRVHRSFIINLEAVNAINLTMSKLYIDKMEIPIGRTYRQILDQIFRFVK